MTKHATDMITNVVTNEVLETAAKVIDDKIARVVMNNTHRGKVSDVAQYAIGLLEDCAKDIRSQKVPLE